MLRKTRAKTVTGQCQRCLDMFDMELVDRRGEISVEPSSTYVVHYPSPADVRAGQGQISIVHKPEQCGGKVAVIWPRTNGPLLRDWPTEDPLAEPLHPRVARSRERRLQR